MLVMNPKRRNFFKIALAFVFSLPLLKVRSSEVKSSGFEALLEGKKEKHIIAKNGESIELPLNPRLGQTLLISVPGESLSNPARLKFEKDYILGEREDLILDSLAIVKIQYNGPRSGWLLIA
jgi:hypothetical protein